MDTTTARVLHDGDTERSCYHCRYFTGHTDWCPAAESETDMTTTETIGADLVLATVPAGVALSTPAEAAARAEEIRGHLTLGFGKLTVAREKRDDLALGYPSWWAYVSGEFGDLDALGLPAEERRYVVSSMRADGMSQRVIAERLDTSVGTVNADLRKAGTQVAEVTGADGKVYTKPQRSTERPAAFVRTAGMSKRAEVVARVAAAGPRGLTCLELERATRWRHGIASSPLSAVARQGLVVQAGTVLATDPQPGRRGGRVVRAGTVREGYAVWVTPEHLILEADLVEDEEV
jgi:RNA polymerase subunit RPABC4/transcription elongation factor Spt4